MPANKRDINLEAERLFENQKVLNQGVRSSQGKFYWATQIARDEHNSRILDACKDRKVLEIGCSTGHNATMLQNHVDSYTGVDISDAAINAAKDKKIPNASFCQVDAHSLPFEDSSFDCVITDSLLHHLDLEKAFGEIRRVLSPDGRLVFFEPLGVNPFFQLYRMATPAARTRDERPFTLKDLKHFEKHFSYDEVFFSGFFVIISAFFRRESLRRVLARIDNFLARTPLRFLFWQISGSASARAQTQGPSE